MYDQIVVVATKGTHAAPEDLYRHILQSKADPLNTDLIDHIADEFRRRNYRRRGDWLNDSCIYPQHHQHEDRNPSFGFNTRTGYAYCHRCGSMLMKDICQQLHIQPADYGGYSHPMKGKAHDTGKGNTPNCYHPHVAHARRRRYLI